MRTLLSFCIFFTALSAGADVGRFLEPIQIGPKPEKARYLVKSSALISPRPSRPEVQQALPRPVSVVLDRELMEARLSEALAHRFQASGKVAAFLTREWRNFRSSPNFIVKIKDCSPDELTSSSFVRFSVWDQGKELGSFAEPVRMAHYVEVFYSKAPLVRGTRLSSHQWGTRRSRRLRSCEPCPSRQAPTPSSSKEGRDSWCSAARPSRRMSRIRIRSLTGSASKATVRRANSRQACRISWNCPGEPIGSQRRPAVSTGQPSTLP